MRSSSGRRNVQRVRGRDPHHFGQIEIDLEVVIVERVVLLRIEHFEQRRRRIAAEVHRHLVDLVEHEQRIARADLGQVLDDAARHRADVGAAMAADLRFVAHAAERHADELAVRRLRDRLAERGLADAGRADQAQDRALHLVHALLHGEIFEDAFLDLLEAEMIGVEHFLRALQIAAHLGPLLPRHAEQPVDVVAHDGRFGRHRRHLLELVELGARLGLDRLRHAGAVDLLGRAPPARSALPRMSPSSFWIAFICSLR